MAAAQALGVRFTPPSGAPVLKRSAFPEHDYRLRSCRYCACALPTSATVFMALDQPFCSQPCRTTFVFSHVDMLAAARPAVAPPPAMGPLLAQQQAMPSEAA